MEVAGTHTQNADRFARSPPVQGFDVLQAVLLLSNQINQLLVKALGCWGIHWRGASCGVVEALCHNCTVWSKVVPLGAIYHRF